MKDKLKKLLEQKKAQKQKLFTRSEACTDVAELRSLNAQMDELNEEIRSLETMIADMPEDTPAAPAAQIDERTATVNGQIPGAVVSSASGRERRGASEDSDPYSTTEYRNAFMAFARTGQVSPELRADATTTTGDISAVIPTTIMKEVIRNLKSYGHLYARVRKMAVQGGMQFPISTLNPTATWISESKVSDRQKVEEKTSVSFSYYGLECRIAVSLLADTVSLDVFETSVTELITEAMMKALDIAIVKGTGSGQPTGITVDTRVPSDNNVTLAPADFASWSAWKKKVFSKLPIRYKAGAVFLMASGTYEGYIDGMVDANGQPIGRTNYGISDGPTGRFGGKVVIEVEDDVIANYDDASTGDVVAILCNLGNYAVNSNLQMQMFRFFDQDKNEWVDKAILIADGKLLDPNGVIIIKKGAAPTGG